MGGLVGTPLREFGSHARSARLAMMLERGLRPRGTGLHFRRLFGDIPAETHPPARSKLPKLQAEASNLQAFGRKMPPFEVSVQAPWLKASSSEMPASLEASRHGGPVAGFGVAASDSSSVLREEPGRPPDECRRTGGDMQSVYCAAKPRSNTVAKREARATQIRLEGGQALPTTTSKPNFDHLRSS